MTRHLPVGSNLRYFWNPDDGVGTSDYFEFANCKWFRALGFAVVEPLATESVPAFLSGKRASEPSPEFSLPAGANIYSSTLILPSPLNGEVGAALFVGWQDDISPTSTPVIESSDGSFHAGTYRPESDKAPWEGIVDILEEDSRIYLGVTDGEFHSDSPVRVGIAVDFFVPGCLPPLYDEVVFGY